MTSGQNDSNVHDPVYGQTKAQERYGETLGPAFDQAASGQPEPEQEQAAQQSETMTQYSPAAPAPMGTASYQPTGVRSDHALAEATSGYSSQQVADAEQARIEAQIKAEMQQSGQLRQEFDRAQSQEAEQQDSQSVEPVPSAQAQRDEQARIESQIEAEMEQPAAISQESNRAQSNEAEQAEQARLETQIEADMGGQDQQAMDNAQENEQSDELDNTPTR